MAMSGHSKWSTIKRKKGAADAKRGKIFTKLIREIAVAAKMGGGDPSSNPRLRTAVAAAKAQNMPKDNVERAIKKGTGELEGVTYEEVTYEAYGPGGVAMLVDCMTDNKQRTVSEVRHIVTKHNGNLGEVGSVAWNFDLKGYLVIEKEQVSEEDLMEWALEAGAEDIKDTGSAFEVFTAPGEFDNVRGALEDKGLNFGLAQISKLAKNTVQLEGKEAEQMIKLVEALEDLDDVQNVYSNSDISEEVLEKLA